MPTLRDHVRNALSECEQTEEQARSDLKDVLARSRSKRAIRAWPYAASAAAALMLYVAVRRQERDTPQARPSGELTVLHLRVDGEPEARALTLVLDYQGEP